MQFSDSIFEIRESSASDLDDLDDVDSLPSTATSDLYSDADNDAQAEWERSLEQLQLLMTMVLVPFVGKYFGRKFAYWSKSGTSILSRLRGRAMAVVLTSLACKVGNGTWSGCTTLKCSLRARTHSGRPEWSRRLLHYSRPCLLMSRRC